ncbi:hypothetical protein ABB37_06758 [Leptomonas pyrrhocoris]|uniref:Uncharacterized protein n=1 Tax=Leptomonas pyrrhocoris TaxID=157538 RepID=A0A0M9FXI1_LEPPY|nr:hypothetical protein ABB37_06758 [Leptomonas pyrrhocoris]KPA77993.1 hypothetical protein ABB37_06758 [Leptomonas pyrrhocoris]|eukprot:XP_015656432.1 hypothetical protein ABB37_06758 [Leptomonas pyrrhocoris]
MPAYDTQEPSGGSHSLDLIGDADAAALRILESNVDFMSLLYCHLAACPPHGPFVYYSAMTLVERAKRRYIAAAAVAAGANMNETPSKGVSDAASSTTSSTQPGIYPMDGEGASVLLRALTIPNVLALIDKRYDTRHLSGWPLLYVPAEIRAADVAVLTQQQP